MHNISHINEACPMDKPLPAYAWPGGYPMFYVDKDNHVLCNDCADKCRENIQFYDLNWEDDSLFCDICNAHIESAYGEESEDNSERNNDYSEDEDNDVLAFLDMLDLTKDQ